jgi:hypothetical protein
LASGGWMLYLEHCSKKKLKPKIKKYPNKHPNKNELEYFSNSNIKSKKRNKMPTIF